MKPKRYDVVVIGGGAGGLSVTSACAQLGLKVLLIEKESRLGGDCLHTGCVPSKALIYCAKLVHQARQAHHMGLLSSAPEVDFAQAHQHVLRSIAHIQKHDDPARFRAMGAEVLFGEPRLVDPHVVLVQGRSYQARYLVLATGSRPWIPPIADLDQLPYWTTDTLFEQNQLPARLAVIGGGVIAVEMAQALARLGSKVTIFEKNEQLLSQIDPDASRVLTEQLTREGIAICQHARDYQGSTQAGEHRLTWSDHQRQTHTQSFDQWLLATGRTPNIDDLGLEQAGVQYHPRQGIVVDRYLRTSQPHILALGDVIQSPYKLTHMAEYHAGVVVGQVAFRWRRAVDHRVVPMAIYCDPEIAVVGAMQAHDEVLYYDHQHLDRAIIENSTNGFIKLFLKKRRIVRAVVVGPHAGELIHPLALLLRQKKSIRHLSDLISPYPSWSQANRRTVNQWFAKRLFSDTTRRWVRRIQRFLK